MASSTSEATAHRRPHSTSCASVAPRQVNTAEIFRDVFLVNYNPMEASTYDFTESRANAYYLSILNQSSAGWPGGLRWLHGEDG